MSLIAPCPVCAEGPLPEGWQELVDQERQATYYWNSVTMETTWIRPKPVQKKKRKQIESESAAKQDDDDEDDEEARRAAVEVRRRSSAESPASASLFSL